MQGVTGAIGVAFAFELGVVLHSLFAGGGKDEHDIFTFAFGLALTVLMTKYGWDYAFRSNGGNENR